MKIENKNSKPKKKKLNKLGRSIILVLLVFLIFLSGALYQQRDFDVKLLHFFQDLRIIVLNEINLTQNNGLVNLYLDIPYKSLDKIYQKRNEAISTGILFVSDEDLVPAKLRVDNGEELDIELRLKGDWTDHLDTSKWSYRIHIKDDKLVLGAKRFSIQAPETRNHVAEWAFHQNCFYEGVLTTQYTFINVFENGVYKGVYAFEESFAEELLESQEQREGVILKLDEELYWTNRASFMKEGLYWDALNENLFELTESVYSSESSAFRDSHLGANPTLAEQRNYALNLLNGYIQRTLPANLVFDVEKTGKYYALVELWAANHAAHWINIRFYFNPVTALLEPIAYDGIPLLSFSNRDYLGFEFEGLPLFNEPEVRMAYLKEMQKITEKDYFENFKESVIQESDFFQKAINREYPKEDSFWDLVEKRRKMLSILINPDFPVRGSYSIVDSKELYIQIKLKNLTLFPVEIIEIHINENVVPFSVNLLDLERSNIINVSQNEPLLNFNESIENQSYPEILLHIPIQTNQLIEKVQVIARVYNSNSLKKIELVEMPPQENFILQQTQIQSPDIDEFITNHPFIKLDQEGNLFVPKGDWIVSGDLIVPENKNLTISSGAHLFFEEDALLFLRGGALNILGTADEYSSISSIGESWDGILVSKASEKSIWQYAEISNMRGFERDGWMVTGGITFYESKITISNSVIKNSFSEDAINVMHAEYIFDNLTIENTSSDGFDGDFTQGKIVNSRFMNIAGDAVDLSGSTLDISDCFINSIGDKGISAGEQSVVNALFLNITGANIGIASKDLSFVNIQNSEINDSRYISLAAFQKKELFGPGTINAINVAIDKQDKIALVQLGSSVSLNNKNIEGQELDVSALYDLGILGN